jgi:hypothetical protein
MSLLNNVAQAGEQTKRINSHKHEDDMVKYSNEAFNLKALQESHRLQRNYTYMKDTELINLYWHTSNQYENGLLKYATYSGLHIDRYI